MEVSRRGTLALAAAGTGAYVVWLELDGSVEDGGPLFEDGDAQDGSYIGFGMEGYGQGGYGG